MAMDCDNSEIDRFSIEFRCMRDECRSIVVGHLPNALLLSIIILWPLTKVLLCSTPVFRGFKCSVVKTKTEKKIDEYLL